MMWQRPRVGVVAGFLGAFGAATCDRRDTHAEASCPPCECVCKPEAPPAPPAASTPVVAAQDPAQIVVPPPPELPAAVDTRPVDIAGAIADASRKMMHDDGKGCLADLDRVAALDPKLDARMAVTRGQCEMLVGRCQAGKARVAKWYVDETNMHAERAAITAETIGAMRCRDGDSTDRDRLLRAYFELSDGAYMNKKPAAACKAQLEIARKLIPKVQPSGPEDGQITAGAQALFHTAATCFAHADDCKSAWTTYRALFPGKGQGAIPDPGERDKIVGTSFDTTITRCTGKR
jgi:hypothetical protein